MDLPKTVPGHWETHDGFDKAKSCMHPRQELMAQNATDFEIANRVYMDPSIMNLTVAKDRIRWLSVQLAIANALLKQSRSTMESELAMWRECDIQLFAEVDFHLAKHGINFTD